MRMLRVNQHIGAAILGLALTFAGAGSEALARPAFQQYGGVAAVRHLVDETQNDLRAAADMGGQHGREKERYRNAQKSLSNFDRKLTTNRFDKGLLNKAIEDVQSVLNHNTLQGSSRDNLLRDVSQLRDARKNHG
jgi:hypothetical protein